jgi:hypothetical protein
VSKKLFSVKALTIVIFLICALGCSSLNAKRDSWVEKNNTVSNCSLEDATKQGLAVIFNTRLRNQSLYGDPYLGWPLANRNHILEQLRKNSTAIVEIPDLALQKVAINPVDETEVVEAYNKSAVEVGAKYLLLLHAAGGIETETNYFTLLYLTIIGAFIFPGNQGSGEASLQAFLYRAGSSKPCLTIETGGSSSQYRPYAFFDSKSLYMTARDRAFKELMPLLVSKLN